MDVEQKLKSKKGDLYIKVIPMEYRDKWGIGTDVA